MSEVAAQLDRLESLSADQLRSRWRALTGTPPPRLSPAMLRLAYAWQLQAKAYGGHSRSTVRSLDQLASARTVTGAAMPGMRLVREWQGKVHVVLVEEDGRVCWEERGYRSLSEVARAITGTRWSGPAFFGLKKKAAA